MDRSSKELERKLNIFDEVHVINVGLDSLFRSLQEQSIKVIHVDWSPYPDDDEEMKEILDQLL